MPEDATTGDYIENNLHNFYLPFQFGDGRVERYEKAEKIMLYFKVTFKDFLKSMYVE